MKRFCSRFGKYSLWGYSAFSLFTWMRRHVFENFAKLKKKMFFFFVCHLYYCLFSFFYIYASSLYFIAINIVVQYYTHARNVFILSPEINFYCILIEIAHGSLHRIFSNFVCLCHFDRCHGIRILCMQYKKYSSFFYRSYLFCLHWFLKNWSAFLHLIAILSMAQTGWTIYLTASATDTSSILKIPWKIQNFKSGSAH